MRPRRSRFVSILAADKTALDIEGVHTNTVDAIGIRGTPLVSNTNIKNSRTSIRC